MWSEADSVGGVTLGGGGRLFKAWRWGLKRSTGIPNNRTSMKGGEPVGSLLDRASVTRHVPPCY